MENHPLNEHIYTSKRDEDDMELEQSISEIGLLEPLTVIQKDKVYHIISGNRRFSALLRLGYKKVECRVVSDEHEIIKLIQFLLLELCSLELYVYQRRHRHRSQAMP